MTQLSLLDAIAQAEKLAAHPELPGPYVEHGPVARCIETPEGLAWELLDDHGGAAWIDPDGWLRIRTRAFGAGHDISLDETCLVFGSHAHGYLICYQLNRQVFRLHPRHNEVQVGDRVWVFGGWDYHELPPRSQRSREAWRVEQAKQKAKREARERRRRPARVTP